jgi:hypothetical protein
MKKNMTTKTLLSNEQELITELLRIRGHYDATIHSVGPSSAPIVSVEVVESAVE